MARIFSVLALLAVSLLVANFAVGLCGGDFNSAARHKREAQSRWLSLVRQQRGKTQESSEERNEAEEAAKKADAEFHSPRGWMTLHMLLGSAAALVTVLVNSITITYFIGTSRWCKEVCETYGLDAELAERGTRLKRSTFPWALAGIGTVIALVGLGAAADPSGANWQQSASFALPHYLAAMAALVVVIVAFAIQISRIAENYAVIEAILSEVERIRGEQHEIAEATSAP